LLCPSQKFRRKVKVAFAFVALVVVGAFATKLGHAPDNDGAVIVAQGDGAPTNAETVQTVGQAIPTATSSTPVEGSEVACEKSLPNYIDVKCSLVRARKLQNPRAANEAALIAALPIGRSTALMPALSPASPDPAEAASSIVSTPAVADPDGTSAPGAKRVRKPSRKNGGHGVSRHWRWPDGQWSARAYAAPDNRYQRGSYERSWGWSW
jgi:hypothetical protein